MSIHMEYSWLTVCLTYMKVWACMRCELAALYMQFNLSVFMNYYLQLLLSKSGIASNDQ